MDVTPVAGHQFADGLISLFMDLVLKAATRQRTAAGVLELVARYLPGVSRVPCANAGRLWLMRLGLSNCGGRKRRPRIGCGSWTIRCSLGRTSAW